MEGLAMTGEGTGAGNVLAETMLPSTAPSGESVVQFPAVVSLSSDDVHDEGVAFVCCCAPALVGTKAANKTSANGKRDHFIVLPTPSPQQA
jgi:hypothetical protein